MTVIRDKVARRPVLRTMAAGAVTWLGAGRVAAQQNPSTSAPSPGGVDPARRNAADLSRAVSASAADQLSTRPIPISAERLPVIGCGTWQGFDHTPGSPAYAGLSAVLTTLFEAGGRVIDSSPMYGRAEQTTGELLQALPRSTAAGKPFIATKVWTRGRDEGIAQMQRSFEQLRVNRIDLMQIHNLVDWQVQLKTLRDWQARGRIRYLGITHYTASAYDEVERVLQSEKLDFLQINYSVDETQAAQRLLPLAQQRGVAVIVNRPFGGGGLLRRLRDRPLPAWAGEIDCTSWAQVLLKFVLSQPAVTVAIPGTQRAEHMADNLRAGRGEMPSPAFWSRHRADLGG